MREIVLDTETTGLSPLKGDRVVEICCVELRNHLTTGRTWHAYLNPERDMPAEAAKVHGLTGEFLADKPVFAEVVDGFLEFVGDEAPLIIHNAAFDMAFVNAELSRAGFKAIPMTRAVDTVAMARKMFSGAPASLDALCRRFNIDSSNRQLHGALLDARLLAEVYLELRGGRQTNLEINASVEDEIAVVESRVGQRREPRRHQPSDEELAAHDAFLHDIKNALWRKQGT